ncbi:MAG: hypothetical protein NC217_06215 [Muribaculaceae bacterium]|nr:hypothetical protein [Muribaculaceae bacterium]
MTDTKRTKVQTILNEEENHSVAVRQNIARQMEALNYGAILWGESVFGSTNYPMVSDKSGQNYNVHGLRLNSNGGVCAIIDYPTSEYIIGVKAYTEAQAEKLIKPAMLICSGIPEEWDILGDCMATAIQVLKGEKADEQPLPWW